MKDAVVEYYVSDEVRVIVNKKERHVSLHSKYLTVDKDWVVMDNIPKKSLKAAIMGIKFIQNQFIRHKMTPNMDKDQYPYYGYKTKYSMTTYHQKREIQMKVPYGESGAESPTYLVCTDESLGTMYMLGKLKQIAVAFQILNTIGSILSSEHLNKRLKEEADEKRNKLHKRD